MNILFIDDEAGIREQAKIFLEKMDKRFNVDTASDYESALEKLRGDGYDIIVADYILPESDGLDILKQLRNEGRNIPFILLTGRDSDNIFDRAESLGADECFTKDSNPVKQYEVLSRTIVDILNE